MKKIKPKFVYSEKNKKSGVLLTVKDFELLIDELEDFDDYIIIQKRLKKKEKYISLEEVEKELKRRT